MVGVFILPNLVKRIRLLLNAEATLIVSLGLCFLMVVLASKAGFSPALGAFVMGSILAGSSEVERIERLMKPLRDVFAAVFFVSIGMLLNPMDLVTYWRSIAAITVITIFGKIISTALGARITGQSKSVSLQAGFAMAQIGEFSFIIAGLGLSMGVMSAFLYPIAVSVSVLTTFATPYLIRVSRKIDLR